MTYFRIKETSFISGKNFRLKESPRWCSCISDTICEELVRTVQYCEELLFFLITGFLGTFPHKKVHTFSSPFKHFLKPCQRLEKSENFLTGASYPDHVMMTTRQYVIRNTTFRRYTTNWILKFVLNSVKLIENLC